MNFKEIIKHKNFNYSIKHKNLFKIKSYLITSYITEFYD